MMRRKALIPGVAATALALGACQQMTTPNQQTGELSDPVKGTKAGALPRGDAPDTRPANRTPRQADTKPVEKTKLGALPQGEARDTLPEGAREIRRASPGERGVIVTEEGPRVVSFGPRRVVYTFHQNSWTRTGRWDVAKSVYCREVEGRADRCYRVYRAGPDEFKTWAADRPFGRFTLGSDGSNASALGPAASPSPGGNPGSAPIN